MAAVKRSKPWQHAVQRYRLRGWRRWLLWWLFGPLALLGLLVLGSADESGRAAGWVLLGVGAVALAAWHWLWRRTVLEVSAEGLCLRQLGYVLQTPWANVAAFHAQPLREGFVLHEALHNAGARRLAAFSPPMGDAAEGWLVEQRFIPIDAFAWHWKHGTLVADVEACAPAVAAMLRAPSAHSL